MYVLSANIQIGNYTLKRVHSVVVKTSRQLLSDTCVLKLPTTAVLSQEDVKTSVEVAKQIKAGDSVVVKLGYNGDLYTEFEGYVSKIGHGTPLEIACEDSFYHLRQTELKAKTYEKVDLKTLFKDCLSQVSKPFKLSDSLPDISLSPFYIEAGVTIAELCQKLKDDYGLSIYFTDKETLFVGLGYQKQGKQVKYHLQKNVIKSDLVYRTEDDQKIQLKAVGIDQKNQKIEVTVGDSGGAIRTMFFSDFEDFSTNPLAKDQLTKLATEKLKTLKYEGYEGTIKTFLLPNVKVDDTACIVDKKYPERGGNYWVESVETSFGRSGVRRKIELGVKL